MCWLSYLGSLGPGTTFMLLWPRICALERGYFVVYQWFFFVKSGQAIVFMRNKYTFQSYCHVSCILLVGADPCVCLNVFRIVYLERHNNQNQSEIPKYKPLIVNTFQDLTLFGCLLMLPKFPHIFETYFWRGEFAELIFCHIVQGVDKGLQPFTMSDNFRLGM